MHITASKLARRLGAVLICVALAGLTACSGLDSDPVTLVNSLRVLAIRADPPYIAGPGSGAPAGPPTVTRIEPLVVGAGDPSKLCYAWVLCPFALSKDGNFRCLDARLEVDLGVNPTAAVDQTHAFASLSRLAELGDLVGTGISIPGGGASGGGSGGSGSSGGGSSGGKPEGGAAGAVAIEFYVQFMISEPRVWGGTCPTSAIDTIHKICPQRDGCLAGYSKLALATSPLQANRNPVMTGLMLDDVLWPAAMTPTTAPVKDGQQVGNPFDLGTVGLALEPTWTADSIEVIRPATDTQPIVMESLTFSWFSTAGDFAVSKSSQYFADTRFLAAKPEEPLVDPTDPQAVTIWVILRDNRNGLAWLSRTLRVDPLDKASMHPLCRMEPSLPGCEDAEPCLLTTQPDPAKCATRCKTDATLPWCSS